MLINNVSIIRQKRKTIKIVINSNAELIVYCPIKLSLDKIQTILEEKGQILNKKLAQIKVKKEKYINIYEYKTVFLLGKEYFIIPTEKVSKIFFTEDSFLVPKKYIKENKLAFFIKKILKDIASNVITKRTENIVKTSDFRFKYNKISYGNFKAKWGSCDNFGVIKFNWRLIMLPPEVIDFVIMHELSHLKELNHSKNFYKILSNLCPNWKKYKKILSEFTFLLSLY